MFESEKSSPPSAIQQNNLVNQSMVQAEPEGMTGKHNGNSQKTGQGAYPSPNSPQARITAKLRSMEDKSPQGKITAMLKGIDHSKTPQGRATAQLKSPLAPPSGRYDSEAGMSAPQPLSGKAGTGTTKAPAPIPKPNTQATQAPHDSVNKHTAPIFDINNLPVQKKREHKANEPFSFELRRDKGSSVKVGTNVTYTISATENGSILDRYNYTWKVIDAMGRTFYSAISDEPNITLGASVPGDYLIQAQILDDSEWVDQTFLQQNVFFEEKNTELGGLTVGNFDFNFDGNRALIEVRVKFSFEDGITTKEQGEFKAKFFRAIRDKWSNSGVSFVSKGFCSIDRIPLEIDLIENESNYHKLVDVEKDYRRPNVIADMNMSLGISENTIAHEFGHVIGLYDEYDGGAIENSMFWHDKGNYQSDTSALMVTGSELRRRYFTNFLNKVNELSSDNCRYELDAPFKK